MKDFIHNLGEALADCLNAHSHCVDLKCEEDTAFIHTIAELCEDYNHICCFVRNFCDHVDESLYHFECPDGPIVGVRLRH